MLLSRMDYIISFKAQAFYSKFLGFIHLDRHETIDFHDFGLKVLNVHNDKLYLFIDQDNSLNLIYFSRSLKLVDLLTSKFLTLFYKFQTHFTALENKQIHYILTLETSS